MPMPPEVAVYSKDQEAKRLKKTYEQHTLLNGWVISLRRFCKPPARLMLSSRSERPSEVFTAGLDFEPGAFPV